MVYSKIFEQSYNKISSFPDFPKGQAKALWRSLPRCSRDLTALIYLLPFGKELTEEQISFAETLTMLTLSSFVHDDLTKGRAFNKKEAVLYGDYFFALAFSLLPDSVTKEEGQRVSAIAGGYNEKRLEHQKIPAATPEEYIQFAKTDYGALLRDIADEAMKKNAYEDAVKEQYIQCAETLGTLWGLLCEEYPVSVEPLLKKAAEEMAGLPMEKELTLLRKEMEGTAIENKLKFTISEK